MFMSEAGKIGQKIKVWFNDYFNISDFAAIVSFFVGFGLRFGAYEESVFIAGRTVYCLNIILCYVTSHHVILYYFVIYYIMT